VDEFESQILAEINQIKEQAQESVAELADQVFHAAQDLVSSPSVMKGEKTLGVKTGRLKRSLKQRVVQTPDGPIIEIFFDTTVAPHAKFVIQGTRKIKPHPILEIAASRVKDEEDLLT